MIFYEGQLLQFNQQNYNICYKQALNGDIQERSEISHYHCLMLHIILLRIFYHDIVHTCACRRETTLLQHSCVWNVKMQLRCTSSIHVSGNQNSYIVLSPMYSVMYIMLIQLRIYIYIYIYMGQIQSSSQSAYPRAMSVEDVYLHIVESTWPALGTVNRRGQQNAMFATLMGLTK